MDFPEWALTAGRPSRPDRGQQQRRPAQPLPGRAGVPLARNSAIPGARTRLGRLIGNIGAVSAAPMSPDPAAELAYAVVEAAEAKAPQLRQQLLDMWVDVTNAGGAVGFTAPADVCRGRAHARRRARAGGRRHRSAGHPAPGRHRRRHGVPRRRRLAAPPALADGPAPDGAPGAPGAAAPAGSCSRDCTARPPASGSSS